MKKLFFLLLFAGGCATTNNTISVPRSWLDAELRKCEIMEDDYEKDSLVCLYPDHKRRCVHVVQHPWGSAGEWSLYTTVCEADLREGQKHPHREGSWEESL